MARTKDACKNAAVQRMGKVPHVRTGKAPQQARSAPPRPANGGKMVKHYAGASKYVAPTMDKPKPKKTYMVRHKIHCQQVEALSRKAMQELVQYGPFERLIKQSLAKPIHRVSSDVVAFLMEAVASYIHSIVESAYKITISSGKRSTLMVCDVSCSVHAKGAQIVAAP